MILEINERWESLPFQLMLDGFELGEELLAATLVFVNMLQLLDHGMGDFLGFSVEMLNDVQSERKERDDDRRPSTTIYIQPVLLGLAGLLGSGHLAVRRSGHCV